MVKISNTQCQKIQFSTSCDYSFKFEGKTMLRLIFHKK